MASSSTNNNDDSSQPPPTSVKDTASFFTSGNSKQFDFVLKLYPQVLRMRAEKRSKKPEKLVRLDDWYQNELPKLIKKRGKDAHLIHEELVQCMEWKQSRGKSYPQLSYLIKVNTPRAVMMETKKAFKKLPNIEQALTALSNLKGVGTTMASAILAAASPENAPFMADECLMAIPEIEGIDYTTKEYLNFVQHIQTTVNRLNSEVSVSEAAEKAAEGKVLDDDVANAVPETTKPDGDDQEEEVQPQQQRRKRSGGDQDGDEKKNSTDEEGEEAAVAAAVGKKAKTETNGAVAVAEESKKWSPHQVELALWTHYVASELQPELLHGLPGAEPKIAISSKFQQNGAVIDDDDETIPDGAESMRVGRIATAAVEEEGSSSHDDYKLSVPEQPVMIPAVHVVDEAANDGNDQMCLNGGSGSVGVVGGSAGEIVASANGLTPIMASTGEAVDGAGALMATTSTDGENSTDTSSQMTPLGSVTMLNSVSSSSEAVLVANDSNAVTADDNSLSREASADAYKFKNGGSTPNNGDVVSTTTTSTTSSTSPISSSTAAAGAGATVAAAATEQNGGTKRFSAEPLSNVMSKCPKLMLDR